MRISDWSADVCSSDLLSPRQVAPIRQRSAPCRLRNRRAGLKVVPGGSMSAKSGVGGKFEDDIASLFRLAGYSIEQNVDYGGQEFDIIATKDEIGKLKSRIAIECTFRKAGTVGNQEVFDFLNDFRASADSYGFTLGMIVSNTGLSRQSPVGAEKNGNINSMSD